MNPNWLTGPLTSWGSYIIRRATSVTTPMIQNRSTRISSWMHQ
uniref:Uncharacterized protein n=1 Tax=Rhizophora mucronata TaxID=61149 RepID=A0A2P2PR84_RHIMU